MRQEVIEARELYPDLTPTQRAFLEALTESGSRRQASRILGISRQTHYDWLNRSPHCEDGQCSRCYRCAFGQAKERMLDTVEDRMFEKAIEGDMAWDATRGIFILKSQRRDIYGEKLDVTSKSISINLTGDIATLTDSDRVSLLQLAADEQRRLLESGEPSHPDDQD